MVDNLLKNAEHIVSDNVKDLLTEVSKETYSDIKELVGDNTPTRMQYGIDTLASDKKNNFVCSTIFTVHLSDDAGWSVDDVFMHVYRSTSVKPKNMEKVIADMANHYKKNILKLED